MAHTPPTAYAQAFMRAQRGKPEKEKETLLGRLMSTLEKNGDEKKMPATLRAILRLMAQEEAQRGVRVVTAITLNAAQKNAIEKEFSASTYQWEVNSSILGGFLVEQGTRLYQMTVRHLLKGFE